jgi:hypothetical protein
MSAPYYQAEPQVQYLYQILRDIARGQLQIPRFQRPFVWDDERRLELFRSLHAGMPIGSIILWKTNVEVPCYDRLGPYKLAIPSGPIRNYVIDGHQRLATFFHALHVPENDADLPDQVAYLDLEELEFFFESRTITPNATWLPLRFVPDLGSTVVYGRSLVDRPDVKVLLQRVDSLVSAFSHFKIPVLTVATNDLDVVAKTFQRVNSQGIVMSEVHMISALTWNERFDLNNYIALCKERVLSPIGWNGLDDKYVLYACKAALDFDVYDADVDGVSRALRDHPEILDKAADALVAATTFLRERCGIVSPHVMPYMSDVVPLAEAIRRGLGDDEDVLRRWFWLLAYSGTRAGLPEFIETLEHLRGATATAPPIPPVMTVLAPLPKRFDYRNARCMTLALRLADRAAPDGYGWLSNHPGAALPHLVADRDVLSQDWFQSPANRILTDPARAEETRGAILGACHEGDQAILERHVIPPAAAAALVAADHERFCMERTLALDAMETAFAQRIGILQYKPGIVAGVQPTKVAFVQRIGILKS